MTRALMLLVVFAVTGMLLKETSATLLGFLVSGALFHAQHSLEVPHVVTQNLWNKAIKSFENSTFEVRFNLAPTFGTLNSKSLKQLDESLRVMIAGILEIDVKTDYTWNQLIEAFGMNFFLRRQSRYSVKKIEKIIFKASRLFGAGINEGKRERMIRTWFSSLIESADILKDTSIDLDALVDMVSKVSVHMLENLNTHRTKKMNLYDVGILRFPDIRKPFFSVYRINLIGRCHYRTYIFNQDETSEILGLFQRERYFPDRKYIRSLNRGIMKTLLQEVDNLFAD